MSQQVSIPTALCLPAPDIEALIEGRNIAAISPIFLNPGRQFALYPADTSKNPLPTEQYYRPSFLPIAQKTLTNLGSATAIIKGWAKCDFCQSIENRESLDILSQLTVWTEEALQETISQKGHIFLAYLRVYRLPKPVEIPVNGSPKFIPIAPPLTVTDATPVFSDRIFAQRRHQLENRLPPAHPELEALQGRIAILSTNNSTAAKLDRHIKTFLGWKTTKPKQITDELNWIYTINDLGTATTGGNYEKGTAFEQIVHKSLAFLGFGVDSNAKGGAGGMDLYCTTPYPLVGECKAGKSIPDSTVEQLSRIGKRHLGKYDYEQTVKLIIGPGEPTTYLIKSAQVSTISIIRPMTLQKLVELHAKYPGSVNLMELKEYLVAGQIDDKIDEYVDRVEKTIKLRSQIVKLVKQHIERTGDRTIEVAPLYGAYGYSNPPLQLTREEMHELLIELSSPLTGYLGRIKGKDWHSDRFYFLRELL